MKQNKHLFMKKYHKENQKILNATIKIYFSYGVSSKDGTEISRWYMGYHLFWGIKLQKRLQYT